MKEINLVHPTLKTKIKVFYLDSITDTIDIQLIYSILNQIHSNIKDFSNASIFSDLTIEIYNPNHDKYPSGLSAGLTHPFKNLIQLSSKHTQFTIEEYFYRLISHEFGHYFSDKIGFFSDNSYMKQLFLLMTKSHLNGVSDVEVFAEIFMFFFGSDKAKYFHRGSFTYPTRIKGIKDLMMIWVKVETALKNIEWYRYLTNTFILTSDIDYNYLEVQIETRNTFFYFDKRLQIIRR